VLPDPGAQSLREGDRRLPRRLRLQRNRRGHKVPLGADSSRSQPIMEDRRRVPLLPPGSIHGPTLSSGTNLKSKFRQPGSARPAPEWAVPILGLKHTQKDRKPKHCSVLGRAQAIWAHRPEWMHNMSIPPWYSGLLGVPNWILRQSCSSKKMDEKRKGLALLVRMNFIMDYRRDHAACEKCLFHCLPGRKLGRYTRTFGPIYDNGAYRVLGTRGKMNTSFSSSLDYDWKRALVCTVGSFVHLLAVACDCKPLY
jgi:hypothetical protein